MIRSNVSISVPEGYCHCGCGEKAPIAKRTVPRYGYIKGKPMYYLFNHHRRKSGVAYVEEDRGYDTSCWIWQRSTDKKGYGLIRLSSGDTPAHRQYYEDRFGRLPEGWVAHHLCEVKPCVNPEHIEPQKHDEHTALHSKGRGCKITQEDADEIKRRSCNGELGYRLAGEFGVSTSLVSLILQGKCW